MDQKSKLLILDVVLWFLLSFLFLRMGDPYFFGGGVWASEWEETAVGEEDVEPTPPKKK